MDPHAQYDLIRPPRYKQSNPVCSSRVAPCGSTVIRAIYGADTRGSGAAFASERIEATEAEAQHDDTKELLERGLTPKQIADLFYSSVYHCDMDTWLATLCDELKSNPSPAAPGGFAMTGWYVRCLGS